MHNRLSGSVVGTTPEGMGHHILFSVKMTLNSRINIAMSFSAFLYHYIGLMYSLRLQGGSSKFATEYL